MYYFDVPNFSYSLNTLSTNLCKLMIVDVRNVRGEFGDHEDLLFRDGRPVL